MVRRRLIIGLLAATAFAIPAQAQQPAFSVAGTSESLGNPPFTLGYTFSLSKGFTATALGLFDDAGDGLASAHDLGLWDSSGTLLASTSISGTSGSLIDGFRYSSISSLLLGPGSYTIGATFEDGADPLYFDSVVTPVSGVSFDGSRYTAGSALTEPTSTVGGNGYFGPNLLLSSKGAVPEPATWAMMLLGFGATGWAVRRKGRFAGSPQIA